MFTSDDLMRLVMAPVPAPPPHTAIGHSDAAENFRLQALLSFENARVILAHLDSLLRNFPCKDAEFDALAEKLLTRMRETGDLVTAFREVRDTVGEA